MTLSFCNGNLLSSLRIVGLPFFIAVVVAMSFVAPLSLVSQVTGAGLQEESAVWPGSFSVNQETGTVGDFKLTARYNTLQAHKLPMIHRELKDLSNWD